MNNNTQYVLILIVLCTANIYGMETELQKISSEKNTQQLPSNSQKKSSLNIGNVSDDYLESGSGHELPDDYGLQHAQQTKEQILQAQITKRKWFNVLCGATTLAIMGVDIANSYWDESGLLTQHYFTWDGNKPCTCPNQTAWCEIKTGSWDDPKKCTLTDASNTLYVVNDGMTMYRLYNGLFNLYRLYEVQQALNTLTVSQDTRLTSYAWRNIQGISSGIMGTIAGVAGVVNGISNYPRTVAVWGINAAVDALGAFNWHQNMNACDELLNLASQAQDADDGNKTDEEQK